MRTTPAVLLLLALAGTAHAQPHEVVVGGHAAPCGSSEPRSAPQVEWIGRKAQVRAGVHAVVAAPRGLVYGLRSLFATREDQRWSDSYIGQAPQGAETLALALDRTANLYLLARIPQRIVAVLAFDAEAVLRATHVLGYDVVSGGRGASIDLAADQCTLFIADRFTNAVRRYNVCSGTPLTDFAQLSREDPREIESVRILPAGGLLVARGSQLLRFDDEGVLVRTYDDVLGDAVITATGLAKEGTVAWVAGGDCSGEVVQIDLESGARLSSKSTKITLPDSLVPYDAWTAAIGPPAQPQTYDAVVVSWDPARYGRWLEWISDSAVTSSERISPWSAGIAPAGEGRIRIGTPEASYYRLEDFRRDGRREAFSNGPPVGSPWLIVVDGAGATYVVAGGGPGGGEGLWRQAPDGRTYDRPLDPDEGYSYVLADAHAIDLAADQCTLFAIEDERVRRYDVCSGKYVDDFLPVTDAVALSILPDGGLLLAAGDRLLRYDGKGNLVRTYEPNLGPLGAMALADRGSTVWLGAGYVAPDLSLAVELDLDSGRILSTTPLQRRPAGIVPYRVWTAALGSSIPRRRTVGRR